MSVVGEVKKLLDEFNEQYKQDRELREAWEKYRDLVGRYEDECEDEEWGVDCECVQELAKEIGLVEYDCEMFNDATYKWFLDQLFEELIEFMKKHGFEFLDTDGDWTYSFVVFKKGKCVVEVGVDDWDFAFGDDVRLLSAKEVEE